MSARGLLLLVLPLALAACQRRDVPIVMPEPVGLGPQVDVDAGVVVIAAAGDISDDVLGDQQATAALVADGGYAAVLLLGDIQYPRGSLDDFQHFFHPTWGRFIEKLRPVPGNHEYLTPGASGYFGYFGKRAGEKGKGWYSFELGAWHLIALNTNNGCSAVSYAPDSEQVKWLREDLAAHRNRCTLAYWHHPRFTSGSSHGDFQRADAFWQTLQQFGADVVLTGHEHIYERFEPIGSVRGFVVGTGGKSHYPVTGAAHQHSEVTNTDAFGLLELTLKPGEYQWRFVPAPPAKFTDQGSDKCR